VLLLARAAVKAGQTFVEKASGFCCSCGWQITSLRNAVEKYAPSVEIMTSERFWDHATCGRDYFLEQGFEESDLSMIRLMFDKVVCALSNIFLGTESSSFSTDISRMRAGLRTATCIDSLLCLNQQAA
jgi:hypothetical protein